MAFSKIIAESMDLTDAYNFTGTLQQNGAGIGGNNKPFFQAVITSDISTPNGTSTLITFNAEPFDSSSLFNTSNGRFVMDSTNAGKYFIYCKISVDTDANVTATGDYLELQVRQYNSSNSQLFDHTARVSFSNVQYPSCSVGGFFSLANGDYVVPYVKLEGTGGHNVFGINIPYNRF